MGAGPKEQEGPPEPADPAGPDEAAQLGALQARVRELEERLEEAESTLRAIRAGEIDALVIDRGGRAGPEGPDEGPEVFTLANPERFYLRMAAEVAGIGTWDYDPRSRRLLWSDVCKRLHGLPPEAQIDGDTFRAVIHPDDQEHVLALASRALEGGSGDPLSVEYRVAGADGPRWLHATGQVLASEGRAVRFIGTIHDVTERRQTQEAQRRLAEVSDRLNHELREADRRKDEFLAMLAHELRNPLAALAGALRLSRTSSLSERDRAWTEDVLDRQVLQLNRLVDDLLDVSRITTGKVQIKRERLQLRAVIGRAVETVRPLVVEARHQLALDVDEADGLWVDADPARLEQVLVNLLGNAVKYMNPGGHIRLSCRREGDEAVLTVADTGIGLSQAMLAKVFDLFAQAEVSLDRAKGGLGIGLTLVKRLVEMHGGSVSAASAGVGQGSAFTVRLPAAEAPPRSASPDAAERAAGSGRRVLVVDDNEDAAGILAMLLRMAGHNTREVYGSREALALWPEFRPEVALLDIGLPEIDGYELARRLREQAGEGVVIIAISGYGQTEDRRRSVEAGFDHHFIKPVDHRELLKLLGSL